MAASRTTAETEPAALGLLIFDGDCGFCTTAARKFGDLAGESAEIAPADRVRPEDFGLTAHDLSSAVYWVQDGRSYRGADAVSQSLRVCPQPWSTLGRIMSVPPVSWLAHATYPLVARFRHRLPGATDSCRAD